MDTNNIFNSIFFVIELIILIVFFVLAKIHEQIIYKKCLRNVLLNSIKMIYVD